MTMNEVKLVNVVEDLAEFPHLFFEKTLKSELPEEAQNYLTDLYLLVLSSGEIDGDPPPFVESFENDQTSELQLGRNGRDPETLHRKGCWLIGFLISYSLSRHNDYAGRIAWVILTQLHRWFERVCEQVRGHDAGTGAGALSEPCAGSKSLDN